MQSLLERLAEITADLAPVPAPDRLPAVVPPTAGSDPDLMHRFTASLEERGTTWEVAENPVAARLRLAGRLHEEGVKQVLAWAGDQLPIQGMGDALEVLDIEVIVPDLTAGDRGQVLAGIAGVETGLTGADAGIAATGSLVLSSGPGRPGLVNQLVRRHIVLLPTDRLFATLEGWLAGLRSGNPGRPLALPANTALISGPSLSEDIELLPTVGVHGPRLLHVILIEDG